MWAKNLLDIAVVLLIVTWVPCLRAQTSRYPAPTSGLPSADPAAKDGLVTLEKSAYEAWKSKDTKFWATFLSDKFVGYGPSGRLDKASLIQQNTRADCEIRSYALSDEQTHPLSHDVMLITHKITVDGTCGGQEVPASSWAVSIFVRDGDTWKGAFHAEAPIVDPKTAAAKPVGVNETSQVDEARPAGVAPQTSCWRPKETCGKPGENTIAQRSVT